ncbi:GTPase family protein [Oxynema aestuarii]|jgi:predicted GTPase|uniref:GTPase n=1 Tax=Oxynema aestuarii AP17 TaxID=2064643 RepID=A0A6H1TU36_9CYAN|nr:GTPase [Oxynema aestuarii]QIZ69460.1 GTPase [Oxynema aestuarii AP17]RMH75363.1 MAG: GTPase [Cyanobacteria bacterium J007]
MVRLKGWQSLILAMPIAAIVIFLLVAAGWQIHEWRINWIWAIFTLIFVGWRWLLVRWTRSGVAQVEAAIAQVSQELESVTERAPQAMTDKEATQKVEAVLRESLQAAREDPPIWEDWQQFWQRAQDLVVAIANIYHPEVKYPLLNIYIPQAYGLIRGTVDDVDRWMQQLSPVLNQVTVGQAYQGYQMYQKLEPSARKLWQAWGWAQWILNPAAALARQASQKSSSRAERELVVNLSQMAREAALRNLARQAIALYGESTPPELEAVSAPQKLPEAKTQTLREILDRAEPATEIVEKPVNILLVGRTGAGKSSAINTLFDADLAEIDVLPSTDRIASYQWEAQTGERLSLWDTPGYEQVNRPELREMVLEYAKTADLLLLVTPALDPALQMDVDFLEEIRSQVPDLRAIAIVTQVDRLRPMREWEPPYDWVFGDRQKEVAIREATQYRLEQFGDRCDRVLPLVSADPGSNRAAWNVEALSIELIEAIEPAKQDRLARFLRDRETRTAAAAKIIDRYTFQMTTTQGLAAFLKSPILQFLSTLSTGSPSLAYLLAEQIPVEQLPVVIGKLQMAYDLFNLLKEERGDRNFDLLALWPVLRDNSASPDRNAWAFGHAFVEYWMENLSSDALKARFKGYLERQESS